MSIMVTVPLFMGIVIALTALFTVFNRKPASIPKADPEAAKVVATYRRRASGTIGIAFFLLAIIAGINVLTPSLLGVPLALAPLIASAGSLLFYASVPACPYRIARDTPRSASLVSRSPWMFTTRTSILVPTLTALILIGVLIGTGVTATTDEAGKYRAFTATVPAGTFTRTPYPGWYYGIPLLVGIFALLAATYLAFRHIGSSPAFPASELHEIDRQWRFGSTKIVAAISTSGLLATLGGALYTAGHAFPYMFNLGDPMFFPYLSATLAILGLLIAAMALLSVVYAFIRSRKLTAAYLATFPAAQPVFTTQGTAPSQGPVPRHPYLGQQ